MKATTPQIIAMNTLLTKRGVSKEEKEAIVSSFSNGRVTSSKELTVDEARTLIKHFKELDPTEARAGKMRGKIMNLAKTIGWRTLDGKADIKSIDSWCEKYSYLKKRLDNYTYDELPKLVTQFENGPYSHFMNNL